MQGELRRGLNCENRLPSGPWDDVAGSVVISVKQVKKSCHHTAIVNTIEHNSIAQWMGYHLHLLAIQTCGTWPLTMESEVYLLYKFCSAHFVPGP